MEKMLTHQRKEKMKRIIAVCLASVILLPLLMLGCNKEETTPATTPATTVPALNGGQEAKQIELTLDDFTAQKNMVKDIELIRPGSLIVTLGANPTTGFQWGEAEISDTAIVTEASHNYVEPQSGSDEPVVGAPGKDVWVFDSTAAGTATIKMSYGRPWEGGEKDEVTLTINITVK
jgi:inhibitor of cysteine peptidase